MRKLLFLLFLLHLGQTRICYTWNTNRYIKEYSDDDHAKQVRDEAVACKLHYMS